MASDTDKRNDSHFVASLEKAMRVLEAFGAERPRMGLTELAKATGLDRSSVQRVTTTFHRLGYLDKDAETRRFSPSIRMSELANAYLWSDELVQTAMTRLIELRHSLGETINFSRLDGSDIVYTVRLPSARTIGIPVSLDDFPRIPLLFGPSPIHPLRRLSEALGGGVEIWAKREDCNSGIAFGGNKVRKLGDL